MYSKLHIHNFGAPKITVKPMSNVASEDTIGNTGVICKTLLQVKAHDDDAMDDASPPAGPGRENMSDVDKMSNSRYSCKHKSPQATTNIDTIRT